MMEKLSGTNRKRGLVCLAVVSAIICEDFCDFEVVKENSCASKMRIDVCTDIRVLLPRRLESLNDAFFRNLFRMSRHSFEKILLFIGHMIEPKLSHKQMIGRNCKGRKFGRLITRTEKLLIFLRIISGGLILDIAWGFGLSNVSVYKAFYEVIYAVYQSPDIGHIYFPYGDTF